MKKQNRANNRKSLFSLLMAVVLLLSCASCKTTFLVRFRDQDGNIIGSDAGDHAVTAEATVNEAPQQDVAVPPATAAPITEATTVAPSTLALGKTAATDTVDFTLKDAKLSYFASSLDSRLGEPIDADDGGIFQTAVGRVLVILTINVKNKDRVTLDVNGPGWRFGFNMGYKGTEYSLLGYDLNNKSGGSASLTAESADGGTSWTMHTSSNDLLSSGESGTYRLVMVAGVDPDSFSDPFTVTVNVPSSSGEQLFTYSVG